MEILNAVKNNKFIYFGFDPRAENKDDQWNALPNLSASNDGESWSSVANFSKLKGLRDGFICCVGDVYYIIGTLALYKTSDFKLFTELDLSLIKNSQYTDIWAPEFFKDKNDKYHIIYSATLNGKRGI